MKVSDDMERCSNASKPNHKANEERGEGEVPLVLGFCMWSRMV